MRQKDNGHADQDSDPLEIPEIFRGEKMSSKKQWPMFEVYESKSKWYWRFVARNGRVMADGGQGYHNKGNAQKAVKRLIEDVAQIYHTSQG